MKTVGIISREWLLDIYNIPLYGIRTDLVIFLRKYKINVIQIPIVFEEKNEFNRIKEIIDKCDGIIFPGGKYVREIDCEIMKYLYEINKPTLGICLGMQVMGETFNGRIRKKVEKENHNILEEYAHDININKNSKLYEILKEEKIKVNSRHNKYIPDTNLSKVAYSEDGILEAIEDKNKKFFIGVQWHPESIQNDIYSKKIFDYFIKKIEE